MPDTAFTLILGAGASLDFGLPLGQALRDQIATDLNIKFNDFGNKLKSGSPEIVQALRSLVGLGSTSISNSINPHRAAAVEISEAMPISSSIDEYVERHRENKLKSDCAKLAIAKAILESERSSKLRVDPYKASNPTQRVGDVWLSNFFRDLTRRADRKEVPSLFKKFSVINFNYDRCFEQLLFHWLIQMYGFDTRQAAEISTGVSIYHPYGKLGELPHESGSKTVEFGAETTPNTLLHALKRIRTFSEAVEDSADYSKAIDRFAESQKKVFVGFGFHQQNLDLLKIPETKRRATAKCYATNVGIPAPRWEAQKGRLQRAIANSADGLFIQTNDQGCSQFWNDFGDVILD